MAKKYSSNTIKFLVAAENAADWLAHQGHLWQQCHFTNGNDYDYCQADPDYEHALSMLYKNEKEAAETWQLLTTRNKKRAKSELLSMRSWLHMPSTIEKLWS